MILSKEVISSFQEKILTWFYQHGRTFPWRTTIDPYKILVSEILLQKTNVRKVPDVYEKIINRFPTLLCLAGAVPDEVNEIIKPIGLSYRSKRLIGMAQELTDHFNSKIPETYDALISLKGVGNYIATAVLVFGFNQNYTLLDTNVIKVIKHEFNYVSDKTRPRTDKNLYLFAQQFSLTPRVKEFNWGLLDYGASLSK